MTLHASSRRARPGRLVLLGLLVALSACARSPSAPLEARLATADAALAGTPAQAATRAEVEAARAGLAVPSVLDEAVVRLEQLSVDSLRAGSGLRVEGRLAMRNPWAVEAERDVADAALEAVGAAVEGEALEAQAQRCLESVALAAHLQRRSAFARLADDLDAALSWVEAWDAAHTLDALEATRLRLRAHLALSELEPAPPPPPRSGAPPTVDPAFTLPALTTVDAPLRSDPDAVSAQVTRAHPAPRAARAEASRLTAEARAVSRARWPWLEWAGLEYTLGPAEGPETLALNLSFVVPLRGAPEAEGLAASARAADARADVEAAARVADARAALETLVYLEARAPRWRALLDEADAAEVEARRWLDGRLGTPNDVIRLLEQIHDARLSVIDRREDAGLASCALLAASGVPLSAWPRRSQSP